MPISCILVPFESTVEFLSHGLSLVIGFCVSCYASTCFSLLISCWMDDVAHVCKVFDDESHCLHWMVLRLLSSCGVLGDLESLSIEPT